MERREMVVKRDKGSFGGLRKKLTRQEVLNSSSGVRTDPVDLPLFGKRKSPIWRPMTG